MGGNTVQISYKQTKSTDNIQKLKNFPAYSSGGGGGGGFNQSRGKGDFYTNLTRKKKKRETMLSVPSP